MTMYNNLNDKDLIRLSDKDLIGLSDKGLIKLAELGNPNAQFIVGYWYYYHDSNIEVAIGWLSLSAQQGHQKAQILLNDIYIKHHQELTQTNTSLTQDQWLGYKTILQGILCVITLLIWIFSGFSNNIIYLICIGSISVGIFSWFAMIGSRIASGYVGIFAMLIANTWIPILLTYILLYTQISLNTTKIIVGVFVALGILLMLGASTPQNRSRYL